MGVPDRTQIPPRRRRRQSQLYRSTTTAHRQLLLHGHQPEARLESWLLKRHKEENERVRAQGSRSSREQWAALLCGARTSASARESESAWEDVGILRLAARQVLRAACEQRGATAAGE